MTRLVRLGPDPRRIAKFCSSRIVLGSLGNFDGLHAGHGALFEMLRVRKESLRQQGRNDVVTGVLSFYPHPSKVLAGRDVPPLCTSHQKLRLLSEFDVDFLCLIHFRPDFAQIRAAEFVRTYLCQIFNINLLVIGEDACVGRNREGDADFLVRELRAQGREARIAPFVTVDGEKIGSARIRGVLRDGNVELAAQMLGRPYAVESRVVSGDKRGRTLGVPTANLHPTRQLLPTRGVYATLASLGGKVFPSVSSVGVRPTFGGDPKDRVETHLMTDGSPDCYGQRIEVSFIERLRDEVRFSSVEELKQQMGRDIEDAKRVLKSPRS